MNQKINKFINLILLAVITYSIATFIAQQTKLNSYSKNIEAYTEQISELNEKKEELLATQENVNSEEYIEKVAREKLEMYYPNETVFIDLNK